LGAVSKSETNQKPACFDKLLYDTKEFLGWVIYLS